MNSPHAITFWGLYIWVAEIVPPATIANGATVNATDRKSTADLAEVHFYLNKYIERSSLYWRGAFDRLEIYGPEFFH
jgi:hypothetical protein